MAVKASANITLFHVIDIDSVVIYYLLQSSTANPPAKPTTDPPGGNWTTTEPTYVEGSTNTLYTVTETIYSDGSFEYTPVSKSTAFEAAKAAYNKATNALNRTTVISDTEPTNINTIWLDTNTNTLKQWIPDGEGSSTGDWEVINSFSDKIDDLTDLLDNVSKLASKASSDLEKYQASVESNINLSVSQTASEWSATFDAYKVTAEGYQGQLNTYISETQKWIKMINGTIFLGNNDSDFTLEIHNDKIEICYKGVPLSRWNTELFFSKEILTKKLVLRDQSWGNNGFGWVANANGSLSFRKIPLTQTEIEYTNI